MKYIVVTGGVVSGLGKGITISSIGRVLKSCGLRVTSIKIDPYLNVDAGTMSPFEHGETFVLDDGGETDLDLGNYERFLDIVLSGKHNITTGKIYQEVINQERRGDYLGKTVQIVPHVTDLVQAWIQDVSKLPVDGSGLTPDVCLIEVGGTVGDIESMVFLETLRQLQFTVGRENMLFLHLSLVPVLGSVGEQKTKPTQHSVKELRTVGLFPDIIVCRAAEQLSTSTKAKISVFCHVDPSHVISVHDVSNIYHVPLILVEQNVHLIIKEKLSFHHMTDPDLRAWASMASVVDTATTKVSIALVGKYTGLQDAYLSMSKSIKHCGIHLNLDVDILWIEASDLEEGSARTHPEKYECAWETLRSAQGVLVAGGFGVRGVEGKVAAAKYARENKVPYLGVCLGMQIMVIEYARNVLGLAEANSAEFDEATRFPVVVFMPEINQHVMGGTMRLGARATAISHSYLESVTGDASANSRKPSLAASVYGFGSGPVEGKSDISERHRHRYEVNPDAVDKLERGGLYFTGRDETSGLRMEIAELPRAVHPYYIGAQFHPEFKSRPNRPAPLFFGLVASAAGRPEEISRAGEMWRNYDKEFKSASKGTGVIASPKVSNRAIGQRSRSMSFKSGSAWPDAPAAASAVTAGVASVPRTPSVLGTTTANGLASPVSSGCKKDVMAGAVRPMSSWPSGGSAKLQKTSH